MNYILNILNAQKDFAYIHSAEDLQKYLLRGSTFSNIDHVDPDGLASLLNMLEKCSGSDPVLLKRPRSKPKMDPELKRMMTDQKKQQRALDRLNDLYLYSDDSISEREYLIRKQQITDRLQEINEAIGMMSQEPWMRTMNDEEFIRQASSFILTQKLADTQYLYYENLAESLDPEILKNFFVSILDSIILRDGRPETVVFRNGLSHTFTYKDS